ncbi:MAG: hypothetical protein BWY61_00411 [Firmicutes bacterium ADurb.Bin354]|nr:MAG: hypothetical protein BWY61_00411 [Firmicutes bacterium ADurb.Bin354]
MKGITMTEEKKRKKLPKIIKVILIVVVCVILSFSASTLIKHLILYIECSGIEEYRTKEIVNNAEDYDIDVSNLIFVFTIYYYGKEDNYHLYIFNDGKIYTGHIETTDIRWKHYCAIGDLDADTVVKTGNMIYTGTMSGKELYIIKSLMKEIDFDADRYCYIDEYENQYWGIEDPRKPSDFKTSQVDPWMYAACYKKGESNPFYTQAADGIRDYLYDKHANEMLHIIEDSWYFDQWMTEIYGEDWSNKITIYRSEKDIVRP